MNPRNLTLHPGVQPFHGLGAAFFPEHHPRDTWSEYVSLLAGANLSFVRMAEFTWDKMEPADGRFDFAWLDDAFGLLRAQGIRVILCTPTAVPPRWACDRYPDICPVTEDGKVWGFGVRRYTCPTSPSYRRLSARLAAELGRRYGRDTQILAWQLDNELGHPFCFCDRCRLQFQEWCRKQFGTIERFNDELVTHFWGQSLKDFSEIDLPHTSPSPSRWLIYHRFFSDMTQACYQVQIDALRAEHAAAPITTNMMVTWHGYDHEEMGQRLDVIAGDHYGLRPQPMFGDRFSSEAFISAYLRGMRHGQPNWFLEFQCSGGGLPGQYRWEALTQVGLGADLINYFRFDTCASGNERGGGMVGVHRRPGWNYHEIKQVAEDLHKARAAIEGSIPAPAKVALLYTFANHCEYARYPKCDEFGGPFGNGYALHFTKHFQALAAQNIACDIAYPDADFATYDVIVAPALYILPRALAAKLERFVRAGGTLVLSSFSGLADEYAKLWDIPIPGPLGEVFGIEVRNASGYREDAGPLRVVPAGGVLDFAPLEDVSWIDAVLPQADNVEVLARFENAFYTAAAVTRRRCERGWAYYLGAILNPDGYARFYRALAEALGLRPTLDLPAGLYASIRVNGDRRLVFLNNPHAEPHAADLSDSYVDLFSGDAVTGRVALKPFEVRVLTVKPVGRAAS